MRVFRLEWGRQVRSARAGVLFGLLVGFALVGVGWLAHRDAVGRPPFTGADVGAFGALSYLADAYWTGLVWALVAGAFAAFGYVEDRVLGRTPYVVVRGVPAHAHAVARVLSSALVPAVITAAAGLVAVGAACALLPWQPFGAGGAGFPPALELFERAPLLNDLLWCLLSAAQVAGLGCLAGLVGAVVANRLVVTIAPVVLVVLADLAQPAFLRGLNPVDGLVSATGADRVPWPVNVLFWLLVAAASAALAQSAARRRETT